MTHTPGPWEWKDDDKETWGQYRLAPGVLMTALEDGTPWGDEIDKANARLISSSPDILKALKRVLKDLEMRSVNGVVDCSSGVYADACAAVAKAEGRS